MKMQPSRNHAETIFAFYSSMRRTKYFLEGDI